MKCLFIGDVCGRPGRSILNNRLREIKNKYSADICIVNGENSAHGKGLTPSCAAEIFGAGADVITLGNHTWDNKAIFDIIDENPNIIRPCNYPQGTPGKGYVLYEISPSKKPFCVINAMGRVNLAQIDCPFKTTEKIVEEVSKITPYIFIDFHAEVTSEKEAFGWYFNGKVSAVIGTHTHVQTADDRVLFGGTAYMTDAGMTGPRDSILGIDKDIIITKFLTGMPVHHELADGVLMINGCIIDIDDNTGKARSIERIYVEE